MMGMVRQRDLTHRLPLAIQASVHQKDAILRFEGHGGSQCTSWQPHCAGRAQGSWAGKQLRHLLAGPATTNGQVPAMSHCSSLHRYHEARLGAVGGTKDLAQLLQAFKYELARNLRRQVH
eukprot:Skav211223  [mRNA]  locus=scaffold934:214814:227438:+ [translate_table: standard]